MLSRNSILNVKIKGATGLKLTTERQMMEFYCSNVVIWDLEKKSDTLLDFLSPLYWDD